MNIAMIGTGYVGLVTGTCFAQMGSKVTCVDIDEEKIKGLQSGILPIYEPGLQSLVAENLEQETLYFTTNLEKAVLSSDIVFIAVGTPPGEDGSADLSHVLAVARQIGRCINRYMVVVNKSTVPVGTADKVRMVIEEELSVRNMELAFDVVSNPEFLKEGAAVADFLKPDRIIVGADSPDAIKMMKRVYAPFSRNREKVLYMNVRDAEMTKYAANSMLAAKISFMNEISGICERLGVDVENVRKGIGSDSRIGYSFIYPGCGYGGSCFPKDVKALIRISREAGMDPQVLTAVERRNQLQKQALLEKITRQFGNDLSGKTFGVWGLAFKPGTDDLREAPSRVLIQGLIEKGARILGYDPVAMDQAKKQFPETWFDTGLLRLVSNAYDAIENAHAMILVTEWKHFRQPDFARMHSTMKEPVIFDGRNQYDPQEVAEYGFSYHGIGREPQFSHHL